MGVPGLRTAALWFSHRRNIPLVVVITSPILLSLWRSERRKYVFAIVSSTTSTIELRLSASFTVIKILEKLHITPKGKFSALNSLGMSNLYYPAR